MGFNGYEAGLKLAGLRLISHYSYITVSVELLSKLAPLISMLMQLLRSATIYLNILATVNGPWHPREHPRWRTGVASIFRRRAAHPLWLAVSVCLCFPFFLFLSCTSSHLCSEPPAAEEIISDNWIRAICISPLRERSHHCTAHSDSWGQGQMGALIGPVKAPNTPLWSELTAIGWLFISNRIAVDPLAEGLQLFFFLLLLQVVHVLWIRAPEKKGVQNVFKTSKHFKVSGLRQYSITRLQGSFIFMTGVKSYLSRLFQDPVSPGTSCSGFWIVLEDTADRNLRAGETKM